MFQFWFSPGQNKRKERVCEVLPESGRRRISIYPAGSAKPEIVSLTWTPWSMSITSSTEMSASVSRLVIKENEIVGLEPLSEPKVLRAGQASRLTKKGQRLTIRVSRTRLEVDFL